MKKLPLNYEKKKPATISIRQSILDRCREINPYYNLSQEVERIMIKYIQDNSHSISTESDDGLC